MKKHYWETPTDYRAMVSRGFQLLRPQAKTRAATKWVERANGHAQENGGKPWAYILVPHDVVLPSATLKGLLARHVLTGKGEKGAGVELHVTQGPG